MINRLNRNVMKSFIKQAAFAACLPWLVVSEYHDAFVVEFDASVQWSPEALNNQTQGSLTASGWDCTVSSRYYFTHAVFQGGSFSVDCTNDGVSRTSLLYTLQSIQGILNAWPLTPAPLPVQMPSIPGSSEGGLELPSHGSNKRDLSKDSTLDARDQAGADTLSWHVDTGVSKLHASNITGTGIRVAVIDDGFDIDVPGLSKTNIAYTHDLVDGDNDVRDNCSFDGTANFGIIGAKGDEGKFGVVGVAPDATYELYRIKSCDKDTSETDTLINAFLEAAKRGVDVITCSFGNYAAFPDDPWSSLATRLFNSGIYVSLPAGNGGPGIFTTASPGDGDTLAGVGTADPSQTPYYTWGGKWTAGDEGGSLRFVPDLPFDFPSKEGLTIWTSNTPNTKDCQLLPDKSTLPTDLSKVIFLSQFDQCWKAADNSSVSLTKEFGIPYVMYYSPSDYILSDGPFFEATSSSTDPNLKGSVSTDYATANRLLEAKAKHGSVEVLIANEVSAADVEVTYTANNRSGLLSSAYTSWGPTLVGGPCPAFLAPGGSILSTFPGKIGGYGVLGGSGEATPFVAGIAALVKQQHPDYTPAEIRNVIATTSRPVKWNDGKGKTEDFLAPVFQQGAGLVDAWGAVHSTTILSTSSLSFNDTTNRPKELTFTIKNTGSDTISYQLSHIGASSGYFLEKADSYQLTKAEVYPVYAEVGISPSTVSIGPGKTASISVSILKDPALSEAATRVSYFGGFINIEAKGATDVNKLSLPYTGFGAPLTTLHSINRDKSYLSTFNVATSAVSPAEGGRIYTCTLNSTADVPASFPGNEYPAVEIYLFMQSHDMRIYIVDAKSGKELFQPYQSSPEDPWNTHTWYWDGSDGNKFFVPAGTYKWRVKTLKLLGDPAKEEDFDIWEAGTWVLKYTADSIFPSNTTVSRR
ncbi:serin endopeptidase [Colletotrichum orchidophilum]|uniref:Serin endopeptidase n=1 Tax=Colletotrichum orchidophilum TaxID=1209926 RepID=A0A1G4BA31_9PEZI|nr:serine endopeptidase [Colletotrichum orchidophilum]OHE98271.1 serin endopeptidase [Colletotrichum orchidophilum]